MADEVKKRDANRSTTVAGVTDDSSLDIVQLRIDPSTKRLKTTSTVSSSALPAGAATEATLSTQSSFDHGSKAVGTSAVLITSSSVTTKKGVLVKAANSNTGTVYVGNSDVTANTVEATDGFEIGAGESVMIEIDDANKVYCIGSAVSQKVFWVTV